MDRLGRAVLYFIAGGVSSANGHLSGSTYMAFLALLWYLVAFMTFVGAAIDLTKEEPDE